MQQFATTSSSATMLCPFSKDGHGEPVGDTSQESWGSFEATITCITIAQDHSLMQIWQKLLMDVSQRA